MTQEFVVKERRMIELVPINGHVEVVYGGILTRVKVGNTGLGLRLIRDEKGARVDMFDYVPEQSFGENDSNKARHAAMLDFSLYELYKWLKSQSKELEELKKKVGEMGWAIAHTNGKLIKAVNHLFTESGHPDMVISDEEDFSVSIDFKGLSELKEDDALITKLKKYHQRAGEYTVLAIGKNT